MKSNKRYLSNNRFYIRTTFFLFAQKKEEIKEKSLRSFNSKVYDCNNHQDYVLNIVDDRVHLQKIVNHLLVEFVLQFAL